MDKLIKIWKLKDNITNMQMVFSCRDDACDFEHSDTELHEGYFATKQQIAEAFVRGMFSVNDIIKEDDNLISFKTKETVEDYLKELGVEDD